jgi:hypothetical protein
MEKSNKLWGDQLSYGKKTAGPLILALHFFNILSPPPPIDK